MNCIVCATDIHDVFYTSVDHQGAIDTYCYGCYYRDILNEWAGMAVHEGTKVLSVCECGKEKHGFASHSSWCAMGESK